LHKSYDVTSAFGCLIYVNNKDKKNGKLGVLELNVKLGINMWGTDFL